MVSAIRLALLFLALLVSSSIMAVMVSMAFNTVDLSTVTKTYRVREMYIVYNRGDRSFNLSDLGEPYLDYPQLDVRQRVIEYNVYVNGVPAEYSVRRVMGGLAMEAVLRKNAVIEPGGSINVTVEYKVELLPPPPNITVNDVVQAPWSNISGIEYYKNITSPTVLWNYSNPLVQLYIDALWRQSNHNLGKYMLNTIRWVTNNIGYQSRIPARHPVEVLTERKGDCDDQANLLITLLRAKGIPAYMEAGLIYIPGFDSSADFEGVIRFHVVNAGPHGWVKAYVPNIGWVPVDLTFAYTATNRPIDHINYGAYKMNDVIIISRTVGGDYAGETVKQVIDLKQLDAYMDILIEIIPEK